MPAFAAFRAAGKWFRGNCHTHTTLSDGKQSPEQVARRYRENGYDFLFLTDHWKAQPGVRELCRKGFLVINGIELHPPIHSSLRGERHHIVGLGVERSPRRAWAEKTASAPAIIRWIRRQGGVPIYAHPYWLGHSIDHMRDGAAAAAMEVFNSVCEEERGLGHSGAHADQALSDGFNWNLLATDDLHREAEAFGGWIMVKARALTPAAVLGAIRRGQFYSTQGPEIRSLTIDRRAARLECSPAREIIWHGEGPRGNIHADPRGRLTESELLMEKRYGKSRYWRVEIIDARGRRAWSNPVIWDAAKKRYADV